MLQKLQMKINANQTRRREDRIRKVDNKICASVKREINTTISKFASIIYVGALMILLVFKIPKKIYFSYTFDESAFEKFVYILIVDSLFV